ncbi:MAG: hypothetical protein L0G99_11450 [Propionibacteriales bacterium]|nr:hypothetical protein [Propionibacteriales bacterium]
MTPHQRPHVLWDMVDGPMPRGILGLGDPDIHLIDGRWTMFLGGFSTGFRNRLLRATLADDGDLATGPWHFDLDRRGRAAPLVSDPPRGSWDAAGMHTPSYVPAVADHGPRIYYTGRATTRQFGPRSRYSIGVLEHRDGRWHRRDTPLVEGTRSRASVLEPFALRTEGRYRMWFQANPNEVGPGEQPDYELRCSDSMDGITDWSDPVTFADPSEGFFDNALAPIRGVDGRESWVMVLARGSNLHRTPDFPAQGLWWMTAPTPSADRADWSTPRRLLDTDHPGTPAWLGAGTYGPSITFAEPDSARATLHFSATRAAPAWPRLAVERLLAGRRPPVPSPFQLSTGSLVIDFDDV